MKKLQKSMSSLAERLRVRSERRPIYNLDDSDDDDVFPGKPKFLGKIEKIVRDDAKDGSCQACGESGDLLNCETCTYTYHVKCLLAPLKAPTPGSWRCSKCYSPLNDIEKILDSEMRPTAAPDKIQIMATMGRRTRKIPMQKRDSREKLNVTFTKRRAGLFRKASELSRLCDAQVAVLVSSPNGKYYHSFAPSSVDAVLDAFLAGRAPASVSDGVTREAHRLALEVEELEGKLRRAKELRKGVGAGECPWEVLRKYEESVTTPDELRALYESLSELKAKYAPNTNGGAGSNAVIAVSPSQSYTSSGNYNFPPGNDLRACTAAAFPLSIVRGLTNNAMHRHENHSYDREFSELRRIERRPSSSSISWDQAGMESGTNSHWFSPEPLSNSVFLPLGN